MSIPTYYHRSIHQKDSMSLPREGSTVRLIGLKNPDLVGQEGKISGYTADNERVMIALSTGVVKVKPKQIEVIAGPSRRASGNNRSSMKGFRSSTKSNMRRGYSSRSSLGGDAATELVETLKSADAMFDLADTSGDGYVSKEEFEYYMKRHTNHSDEMIEDGKSIQRCYLQMSSYDTPMSTTKLLLSSHSQYSE